MILEDFNKTPFKYDVDIHWGEMDSFGHLNNVHFFRYMETARIDYLEQTDFFKGDWKVGKGLGPILLKIECTYLSPVHFPDTLTISCSTTKIGNTSFHMEHGIYSQQQQKLVAEGKSIIVLFDYDKQSKTPIPDHLRKKL